MSNNNVDETNIELGTVIKYRCELECWTNNIIL